MSGSGSSQSAGEHTPARTKTPVSSSKKRKAAVQGPIACDICGDEDKVQSRRGWNFGKVCWKGFRSLDSMMKANRDGLHAMMDEEMI